MLNCLNICHFLQKEPELLSGNDVIWTFVKFSGEDHTNFQTLVAFLKMLGTLVGELNSPHHMWLKSIGKVPSQVSYIHFACLMLLLQLGM